jgi:hypothetical protein
MYSAAYNNNYFFKGRVCVLLVDLAGYDSRIAYYYSLHTANSYQASSFPLDFGVPLSIFGVSFLGFNCMQGLISFLERPHQDQKVFSYFAPGPTFQVTSLSIEP